MIPKKKIRTVIISGKSVFGIFVGVLGMILIVALFFLSTKMPAESGDFCVDIIKIGVRDKKWDEEKINKIIGFEYGNNLSVLYNYHGIFGKTNKVSEKITETPPKMVEEEKLPTATTFGEAEFPIEEMDASKGMAVSNLAGISVDADALSREKIDISLDYKGPEVLIVHTHTTESFTNPGQTKYTMSDSDRSTDNEKNIVAVGEVMADILESEGIGVIHDTTVHDYPSYSGAYTRSMATVEKNLKDYSTIKLVLDVHRDGIIGKDGEKIKVISDINGKKAAQCMFVIGSNAILTHDNWILNMRLACNLQKYANENFPGLMRAINLRKERFNQQVSPRSIIIEVGSNGNTLDEAKIGAEFMAKTIAAVLKDK